MQTERLDRVPIGEALIEIVRSSRLPDFVPVIARYVAEVYLAVSVKAARHDCLLDAVKAAMAESAMRAISLS